PQARRSTRAAPRHRACRAEARHVIASGSSYVEHADRASSTISDRRRASDDMRARIGACSTMGVRIEDYALLGDTQTIALVGRTGSIDWLCFPRFDSSACFAALLGTPEHGRWLIAPRGELRRVERRYRGSTLVLETTMHCDEGSVRLIDFMPLRGR